MRPSAGLPQHYAPAYKDKPVAGTLDAHSMRWRFRLVGLVCAAGTIVLLMMAFVPKQTTHTGEPIHRWNPRPLKELIMPDNNPYMNFIEDKSQHPISQLAQAARSQFDKVKAAQSRTLKEAVVEYRRRYQIPPPPHFDKWWEFAKDNNVQMIDEYDSIHDGLMPFWGMEPATIRERVREALGYSGDNALIAITIREGKIVKNIGGPDWQRDVTADMMAPFLHLLPDIDLAFNIHDEPRIVVPHGELAQILEIAQKKNMPAALANTGPWNKFSPKPPADLGDGLKLKQYRTTRFNEYAHQATWVPSRMSCPSNSAARNTSDDAEDNYAAYSFTSLGFLHNVTASTDICLSPSLRHSHGFFDRPNAFKLSHELIPIFSQSKVSSYQDILYPSPWYYYGKTVTDQPRDTHKPQYEEGLDMAWEKKQTSFWWRGTTTGGYSRYGGWRNQHRQQFIQKITSTSAGKILVKSANDDASGNTSWQMQAIDDMSKYTPLIDIHFTGVGLQCDPGDCDEQRSYFTIAKPVNSQDAWKYRHLLDMDGNAFSGRFYALLRSHSAVFKLALFREWHDAVLQAWVHYVPLSFRGEEYFEVVRYASEEEEGKEMMAEMARESREWAGKVLRNVDMEAYLFRVMLEYARVVDESRGVIGFDA